MQENADSIRNELFIFMLLSRQIFVFSIFIRWKILDMNALPDEVVLFRLFKISSRQVFMGAIIFLIFFNLHNLKQTHLNLAGLVNSILAATSKMRKKRREKKRFGKLASVFYCENHSGNLYKIRRSWLWALVDLGAYTGNRAHLTEDSTLQETPSYFTFLY